MKFKKAVVRILWIIAVIKQDQWTSSRSFPANEEILFGFFCLVKTGSCRHRLNNAMCEWTGKTGKYLSFILST